LFEGLAGMGLALSDLASVTGEVALHAAAIQCAQALFKYGVPRDGGIGFLGAGNRFTADLADGSAGILLFLDQVRTGRPNALFTLDG
jgi:lantibiotic modifying enzyme